MAHEKWIVIVGRLHVDSVIRCVTEKHHVIHVAMPREADEAHFHWISDKIFKNINIYFVILSNILFIYLIHLRKSSRRGVGWLTFGDKICSLWASLCAMLAVYMVYCLLLRTITHMHEFAGQYLKQKICSYIRRRNVLHDYISIDWYRSRDITH